MMDSDLTTAFQIPPNQDHKGSGDKKIADKGIITVNSSSMATIQDDDERLLARIGYKQEMRREFSKWSTISYAISILGVLGSVPATFGQPLSAGGPATAVWCWLIGSVMAMCIGSSVAELVSAYPTAGGMYFVTKHVVPKDQVPIFAWIQGWCNLLGQTAGVSSVAYTVSQMLLAAASMNSNLDDEGNYSFKPTALQTVLLSIALLCIMGIICSLTTKSLHRIILWFAPINILASIGICIALLVLTPNKQSAHWVFTNVTDGSGWHSKAFSFLLGFIAVAWTMTDYDGTTHMSEETHDAAVRGPVAIQTAVVVSGAFGWMLTVTMCFCITDLEAVLKSPTGLPAAQIFLDAGGKTGGTIMWSFAILVQFFTGCSAMLADTRMAYAFARDDALPFSKVLAKVNPCTLTPVNAVWFVVFFSVCLNCIAIGSTETASSIFSITAPCLDLSYIGVILAHRLYKNKVKFIEGPFTLGSWGATINWISISWVLFISIVLFFPPIQPVTPQNMNYASVVVIFIALFALSWWWLSARRRYTGPRTKELLEEVPSEDFDTGPYGSFGA
ncbi:Programmed cell death protein 2, C-terminal putative domain family protein [Trichophyton interdigitale]|uniref:Programmed cell death protein 2, C-terminal putative domain family protein n=1 Tax=Trichophyton interdigitale TaxID=101480 RepID=A0A9P5CYG5_9EURO|nr:Programmed cell death protein 2, C-terminal putative domain family protein [Trichophyton interdigitale]KAF3898320.1 Programmed cell death protein 2, C-terminal putative domain family protein [Trichophyton interdigitale]